MMEPQTTPNVASIVETAFTWPKGFTVMGCMPDSRLKTRSGLAVFQSTSQCRGGLYDQPVLCGANCIDQRNDQS